MGNVVKPNMSNINSKGSIGTYSYNNSSIKSVEFGENTSSSSKNTTTNYSYNNSNSSSSDYSKLLVKFKEFYNDKIGEYKYVSQFDSTINNDNYSETKSGANSSNKNSYKSLAESAKENGEAAIKEAEEKKAAEEKAAADKKAAEEKKKSESDSKSSTGQYGTLDMNDYPTDMTPASQKARAVLVAKYLVQEGGYTKEQAAAMAGVFMDENGCDPTEVNTYEQKKYSDQTYGAGIASWTNVSYKNQCLKDAGYAAGTKIENLTMQQQCDMLIAMGNKSQKRYYDALKRCDNIEDASATAVVITAGIGYSSNWSTHPTAAEAQHAANVYASSYKTGSASYNYCVNMPARRLANAKAIYAEL